MHTVFVMLNPTEQLVVSMPELTAAVDHAECAALRLLGLDGALGGETKTSCSELADRLDASTQTASRRLQRLEDAGLIRRETVTDGQWIEVTDDGKHVLRLFDGVSTVELTGAVTSGMGEGRHYITLEGYMRQFCERLGYEPFPGTLNIELTDASVRRRSAVGSLDPIPIDGWEDDDRTYGPAVCYPAAIQAEHDRYEQAHMIAPERTHHDEDQVELIAPDKLRDELALDDGDHVTVTIQED